MDAINSALSGLSAAEKRLQAAAQNIANQLSENYKAQKIEQTAIESGGVKVEAVEKDPATITTVDSEGNPVELPNVSLEEEVVQQIVATYTYKANLRVLQTAQDLQEALLNIET